MLTYVRQYVDLAMIFTKSLEFLVSALLHKKVCFQCFYTVGWEPGRASGLKKMNEEMLVWLSVWSEVQIVCIWSI